MALTLSLASAWLVGCGDRTGAATDASMDGASGGECTGAVPFEVGDPDGHPEPLGAAAGEARAGRLGPDQLPADPEGLSTVQPGDFVLANDRVAAIIEDVGDSDVLDPWGGKLVGLARVRDGALVEPADFNEVLLMLDRFTIEPRSVAVLSDGSAGGAAVVRAVGPLSAVPFLDPLVQSLLPDDLGDIEAALDWILEPDSDHVDVVFTFSSMRTRRARVRVPLHFFFQTMRMPQWIPGSGFSNADGPTPYVAFIDEAATSFAWRDPEGDLSPFIQISGATVFQGRPFQLEPCGQTRHPFARVQIGGPGLDGLVQLIAREEGVALRAVTGAVTEADGTPAGGVHVHAESADGAHLTRALTGGDGAFTLHVPEAAVRLTAYRRGDAVVGPQTVAADRSTVDLRLAAAGTLRVRIRDAASGMPMPARVQVIPALGAPAVPDSFGETPVVPGRLHVEFPVTGEVTLRVPPGRHTVAVSRGYEYELFAPEVDVGAGETVEVVANLERVVATPGVMCGDFHIHTHRSMDAADSVRKKVASIVGDGVEIALRSDHEWVGDFEPTIAAMGVGGWTFGISSLELTTFAWGHFGVFPLDADPTRANGGAPRWYGRAPPEVFAELRARTGRYGTPAIIINHPRSPLGLMGEEAYFTRAGYDPTTGTVTHAELWDEEFNLVEVFNDSDFDDNLDTVADWFSFLNAGRRVFAVGSSDSHQVTKTPVGYPRTCVAVGVDDPEALRSMGAGVVRDELSAGHAVVSGGVFVTPLARGDAGPGDEVSHASARETVAVTVSAASWVDVDSLRVYVDGALSETFPIDDSTTDPMNAALRLQVDVQVDVAAGPLGSWVVFVASGDTPLDPVHPGRMPFGVSNPIFFTR